MNWFIIAILLFIAYKLEGITKNISSIAEHVEKLYDWQGGVEREVEEINNKEEII